MNAAQWKKVLKDITENALTLHPDEEMFFSMDPFTVRRRLLQLVEACHLIDVRIKRDRD